MTGIERDAGSSSRVPAWRRGMRTTAKNPTRPAAGKRHSSCRIYLTRRSADQSDDAVAHHANPKIHSHAPVHLKRLVLGFGRQVGHEPEINRVSENDGDQVAQQTMRHCAEPELVRTPSGTPFHGLSKAVRTFSFSAVAVNGFGRNSADDRSSVRATGSSV